MMHVDTYAYANRIRAVDPAHKAILAVLLMVLSLVLDRPATGLLAALWAAGLALGWAGLPGRAFARVVLAETTFIVLGVVGVAISVAGAPPAVAVWYGRVGPWYLSFSSGSLYLAARLAARALGGAAALSFLAMSTPMTDLINLLRRLHLPELLLDLMTVSYRYIFVLLESMQRMVVAQESRSGYSSLRCSMRSAAQVGTLLFLESWQRSRRLDTALESRGGADHLRVLPREYLSDRRSYVFGAAILASMILVRLLL
jgi:cobalt/nickel transport system permease protein